MFATTGIITTAGVRRLGLVGPVARGSGFGVDVRADHPCGPYAECHPAAASRGGRDVLARFQVMLAEAAESVRLMGDFLDAAQDLAPPEHGL